MPDSALPRFKPKPSRSLSSRTCQGHRTWIRRHLCSVPDCRQEPIVCAHVRNGTDGGTALKPSDKWTISLCQPHHGEQHDIGEPAFEAKYGVNLKALAMEFARQSPYWLALHGS